MIIPDYSYDFLLFLWLHMIIPLIIPNYSFDYSQIFPIIPNYS